MNRKTKQALKIIVKECLVEILSEGLAGSEATLTEARRPNSSQSQRSKSRTLSETNFSQNSSRVTSRSDGARPKSYLDNITMSIDANQQSRTSEKQAIMEKVSHLAKDDIMADILADTAMTTLREQSEGNRAMPSVSTQGDQAAKIANQSDPSDLFGGAASNWANLAFAPSIRK